MRRVQESDTAYTKGQLMFGKLKKNKVPLKPEMFTIRWYPSSRSCAGRAKQKVRPELMPPLMVRKPEWRR